MASVPEIKQLETVEERFKRLAATWRKEVGHLSSSTAMAEHPAYQEIIAIGQEVVPLLLRDLEKAPNHWFKALRQITGANPVVPVEVGNLPKMTEAWLRWAKENGYQW